MSQPELYADPVIALADLAGRAGARDLELGYQRDDVPVDQAGWYASASYKGARLMVDEHRSPTAAAMALAERLLTGGICRCGQLVALADDQPGCRWRLMGQRWEPTCDAPTVHVDGAQRGDLAAMQAALHNAVSPNRRERRARRRGGR